MAQPQPKNSTLWFCVRFIALAPICLVLWLLLLPSYTWVVGHGAGLLLKYALQYDIDAVVVTAGGFLNTGTEFSYVMPGHERAMPDIGHLVTNVAPFIALVLATAGLGLWRRLKILCIGVIIIFLLHVATIILRFDAFRTGRTSLPTAVGFIAITLPFLLWIVLAYWDKAISYFGNGDAPPQAPSSSEQPRTK